MLEINEKSFQLTYEARKGALKGLKISMNSRFMKECIAQ
jgi:hypothetical protein